MKKIIEYINIDENFDDIGIHEPIKISNTAEKTIRQIFHSPLYNSFSKPCCLFSLEVTHSRLSTQLFCLSPFL